MEGVMKKIIFVFFILFGFSYSLRAGEIYIWKDKNGVENITTTPPPENAKVRDRMQYQRDTPEAIQKYETERKMKEQGQQINRGQANDNNKSKTYDSAYEKKRKELSDNYNRASREYNEENKRRENSVFNKKPTAREKELREKMFKAQEEESAFLFSPENIEKGRVYQETTTTTITRGKK
jgi:hypothetical protein